MAGRIRSIKPEVLDDETAAALSDTAWRLWVSSWVLADDHGRFRAAAKYLAANVWQDTSRAQDAEDGLAELVRVGFIRLYEVEGQRYAEIKPSGWRRHQRIDHPGKPRVPTPEEGAFLPRSSGTPRQRPAAGDSRSNDIEELAAVSRTSSNYVPRVSETLGPRAYAGDPVGGRRSAVVIPAGDSSNVSPKEPDHTHTAGAHEAPLAGERAAAGHPEQPAAPLPLPDPDAQALLEALEREPAIADCAAHAPRGRRAALVKLAEHLAGRRMGKGTPLEHLLTAIGEAARDLGAESSPRPWDGARGAAMLVARYADNAKPPRGADARAGPRRGPTTLQQAPPTGRLWKPGTEV